MPTNQHSLAVIALITICIGSGTAWSNLPTVASTPTSVTKIDFDQVFADAEGHVEFEPFINRQRKGDRLPVLKSGLPEPVLLPYCEPVAARFVDPILGRVLGRCMA
jgi:hypothetical protein